MNYGKMYSTRPEVFDSQNFEPLVAQVARDRNTMLLY